MSTVNITQEEINAIYPKVAATIADALACDEDKVKPDASLINDLGAERLRKSEIDELITTDTVARPAIEGVNITTLSVAGLLGEAIKRIHSNSSVTSLFELKG